MDVLSQALRVVSQTEETTGHVTLTFDLDEPAQRAAYAAAVAVLSASGADVESLMGEGGATDLSPVAPTLDPERVTPSGEDDHGAAVLASQEEDEQDAQLRRGYLEALAEMTPDKTRQQAALLATYPRVRELLRDGANVAAVAQIQYRRWSEEGAGASRN